MKIKYNVINEELTISLSINNDDKIKYQITKQEMELLEQCEKSNKLSVKLFGLAFLSDKLEGIFKSLEDISIN
jgi:predicted transcriptional regulator